FEVGVEVSRVAFAFFLRVHLTAAFRCLSSLSPGVEWCPYFCGRGASPLIGVDPCTPPPRPQEGCGLAAGRITTMTSSALTKPQMRGLL
ncbi:unnamed protein product, partial [Gulo gulo]